MFGKISSTSLGKEIDAAAAMFQTVIDKLNTTVTNAKTVKAEKEKQIEELQNECGNLDNVVSRAEKMSAKISDLLK